MNKLMPINWTNLMINERALKYFKKNCLWVKNPPNKIPGLLAFTNKFHKTFKE